MTDEKQGFLEGAKSRPVQIGTQVTEFSLAVEPQFWVDKQLNRLSEFVSPILIKETRQSLKSRQFLWTFFLLLIAVVGWSMLGYSISVSDDSVPTGQFLLTGFWSILAVPLGIIIPFSVFRSMASEFENDTIQLVTITTMRPHQIVLGKLGSAMLQMLVYFSVLAPCIAFTYLLRGVDLVQIAFGLLLSFFGSLGLSTVGLFLAGTTSNNVIRVGISVGFMFGLFMAFSGFNGLMSSFMNEFMVDATFMTGLLFGFCAAFFAIGLLAFSASASQISFPADNRSTMNRVAMLVFNVVAISLFGLAITQFVDETVVWTCHMICCHIWLIFGFLMCAENPFMSPRVRRGLPQTIVGRSFFSFLVPGPGRGYLFAFINLLGWSLVLITFAWGGDILFSISSLNPMGFSVRQKWEATAGIIANFCYAMLFLSCTYTIVLVLRKRRIYLKPVTGLIFGVIVVGMSIVVSTILHFSIVSSQLSDSYSGWQVLNWYWSSLVWLGNAGGGRANYIGTIVFGLIMLGMTVYCSWVSASELLRTPIALPKRVAEDDAEQLPSYVPPEETIETIFAEREEARSNDS